MADPRGGRREKVKINENSSSAGAIEKLPGAGRGCEVGFETCWREYFFPPTLYPPIHLRPPSLDLRPRAFIRSATEAHSAARFASRQLHRKTRSLFSHPRAFSLLSCPIGVHPTILLHCRNCEHGIEISMNQEHLRYLFIFNIKTIFVVVKPLWDFKIIARRRAFKFSKEMQDESERKRRSRRVAVGRSAQID